MAYKTKQAVTSCKVFSTLQITNQINRIKHMELKNLYIKET